jgi:hypothetical protein
VSEGDVGPTVSTTREGDVLPASRLAIDRARTLVDVSANVTVPAPETSGVTSSDVQVPDRYAPDEEVAVAEGDGAFA